MSTRAFFVALGATTIAVAAVVACGGGSSETTDAPDAAVGPPPAGDDAPVDDGRAPDSTVPPSDGGDASIACGVNGSLALDGGVLAWTPVGSEIETADAGTSVTAFAVALALGPANAPYVAYGASSLGGLNRVAWTSMWTGSSWQIVGGAPMSTNADPFPVLAVDSSGKAYSIEDHNGDFLVEGNATGWTRPWPTVSPSGLDALVVAPDDTLYAAVGQLDGGAAVVRAGSTTLTPVGGPLPFGVGPVSELRAAPDGTLYVASYVNGSVDVARLSGGAWKAVGAPLPFTSMNPVCFDSACFSLAIDCTGAPIVAMMDTGGPYVHRWDGASWRAVGTSAAVPGTNGTVPTLAIAVDESGAPWLSFYDANVGWMIERWTGSSWQPVGAPPTIATGLFVPGTAIAARDHRVRAAIGFNRTGGTSWSASVGVFEAPY